MPKADGQRKGATLSHNTGPDSSTSAAPAPLGSGLETNRLHCIGLPEQPDLKRGAADLLHPPISSFWQSSRGLSTQDSTEVMLHAAALGLLLIRISLN